MKRHEAIAIAHRVRMCRDVLARGPPRATFAAGPPKKELFSAPMRSPSPAFFIILGCVACHPKSAPDPALVASEGHDLQTKVQCSGLNCLTESEIPEPPIRGAPPFFGIQFPTPRGPEQRFKKLAAP